MIDDLIASAGKWSDLSRIRPLPKIDFNQLHHYRLNRIKSELTKAGASLCLLVSPISLRYAIDYRCYGLFQAHIPTSYAIVAIDGATILYNAYDQNCRADECRQGQHITFFDGGFGLREAASKLAEDIENYLSEIGSDNRTVALEYVNPSITQALQARGMEVIDGVPVTEHARVIKSVEELECMRWAIAVAEHGIEMLAQAIAPGVSELQLWGLLNYTNLANNGDWHDGRMLASGPRINPWLQEASPRQLEAGDLVGFDTDMIGPYGYFADISRTLFCGPGEPTRRQKTLYREAYAEIQHNMALLRPGLSFSEFQASAYPVDPQFHQNAYTCIAHAVGMCDEYPRINPIFRGPTTYDGTFEAGMVICVESYVGAVGERDGVKLEEQVLITEEGYERLSTYPYEQALL